MNGKDKFAVLNPFSRVYCSLSAKASFSTVRRASSLPESHIFQGFARNPSAVLTHKVKGAAKPFKKAGQVSINEHGVLVGEGDLAAQTVQAMRNVGLALSAVGASYADIVKITTYVVGYKPEYRSVIGKARAPFFADREPPASTLIGVAALALPQWIVEIEAIAVVD